MTIGDRIRRIRKKRRLTQAELAMMSGLSLSAIRAYEQGRYEPKRKPLESIAEVFKIPADELYDTPAQHGTNLASLGTDCISRQAAIDWVLEGLNNMPSAQPEIIRCRNCKFASGDSRICMKFGHSPIGELDFCAWAERRTDE